MKVTLIQPESKDSGATGASFYKNIPSQGLIQLEALTPLNWEVKIINENIEIIDFNEQVDVVGITATTSLSLRAYEIAKEYKKRGILVIMGGVHASIYPQEASKHVDSVVIGEADEIWSDVLKDVEHNKLKNIYKPAIPSHLDFNFQRRPKRTYSVGITKYIPFLKGTFTYFQTGRGCPIGCDYCSVTQFNGKKIRKRSIDKLIEDIKIELTKHKVDYLVFMDDNIVADKQYAISLFKELKKLGVRWMSQTDIRIADKDIIDLAAESGLALAFLGLESINPEVLTTSVCKTKNKWRSCYEPSIEKLHKKGIAVVGSFIIGSDADASGVGNSTAKWAINNKLDTAIFYILTPLPGTTLFQRLKNQERITTEKWSDYDLAHCVFIPKYRNPHLILEEVRKAHSSFYSVRSIFGRINKLPLQNLLLSLFMNFDFRKHSKI